MMIKLIVRPVGDENVVAEHEFEQDAISIGRARSNDVVLPDPERGVSGKHARIERRGGTFLLIDQSTNGTFLGERRLEPEQPVELRSGDRITIETFQLEFLAVAPELEQTMARVDRTRQAADLAADLATVYARHAAEPPPARMQALKGALRARLSGLDPDSARTVCAQIRSRFAAGGPEAAAGEGATDEEIALKEELYQVGYRAARDLSRRFLGDREFESAEQVERFFRLIEQTLEVTVEWLAKCLQGRKEFEKQFSAELTMIFSREGNPIKSASADTGEIARFLLDWWHPRDLAVSKDALEDAFKDLTMHQLGLLSGVQACLRAVLERLEPKAVEEQARAQARDWYSRIVSQLLPRRSAWRQYVENHAAMFEENSKLFNEMIYPSIRKGYLASHADSGAERPQAQPPDSGER